LSESDDHGIVHHLAGIREEYQAQFSERASRPTREADEFPTRGIVVGESGEEIAQKRINEIRRTSKVLALVESTDADSLAMIVRCC
jgi:di/tripeptidase